MNNTSVITGNGKTVDDVVRSQIIQTGALFASTNGPVEKLVRKQAKAFCQLLADVEQQLSQHR